MIASMQTPDRPPPRLASRLRSCSTSSTVISAHTNGLAVDALLPSWPTFTPVRPVNKDAVPATPITAPPSALRRSVRASAIKAGARITKNLRDPYGCNDDARDGRYGEDDGDEDEDAGRDAGVDATPQPGRRTTRQASAPGSVTRSVTKSRARSKRLAPGEKAYRPPWSARSASVVSEREAGSASGSGSGSDWSTCSDDDVDGVEEDLPDVPPDTPLVSKVLPTGRAAMRGEVDEREREGSLTPKAIKSDMTFVKRLSMAAGTVIGANALGRGAGQGMSYRTPCSGLGRLKRAS